MGQRSDRIIMAFDAGVRAAQPRALRHQGRRCRVAAWIDDYNGDRKHSAWARVAQSKMNSACALVTNPTGRLRHDRHVNTRCRRPRGCGALAGAKARPSGWPAASQIPRNTRPPVLRAPLEAAGSRWKPLDNGGPMEVAADLLNWADRYAALSARGECRNSVVGGH
jgi:hypothetical protein